MNQRQCLNYYYNYMNTFDDRDNLLYRVLKVDVIPKQALFSGLLRSCLERFMTTAPRRSLHQTDVFSNASWFVFPAASNRLYVDEVTEAFKMAVGFHGS